MDSGREKESELFEGRERFKDRKGSGESGRPADPEGPEQPERPRDPGQSEGLERPKGPQEGLPKVVPMEGLRRRSVFKDPYKLGLALQICLTVLLIFLLIYCLFPFFSMMDRLDIPIRRVIYIPLAVVAVVIFFVRRAVRLVRRFREERP